MPIFDSTPFQKKQIEVINNIENQVKNNSIQFSTVDPVEDYENDPRICLTGVHFPNQKLVGTIYQLLINPLREISPEQYYYEKNSLHMTIKGIRNISDPPSFNEIDIQKAKEVFSHVIPKHHSFQVYFYRLLLFPSNLALIGTTDPELDEIALDLDKELKKVGVPDDKQYMNSRYFFCNVTLARFNSPPTEQFKKKVEELSQTISIPTYKVDSVSLVIGNAAMKKKHIIAVWKLNILT